MPPICKANYQNLCERSKSARRQPQRDPTSPNGEVDEVFAMAKRHRFASQITENFELACHPEQGR
jgi:hypothetical protein